MIPVRTSDLDPEKVFSGRGKRSTPTTAMYPWDEWTDGKLHYIVVEDLMLASTNSELTDEERMNNFRANLYNKARKLGLKVTTRMKPDTFRPEQLFFRFYDPKDEHKP